MGVFASREAIFTGDQRPMVWSDAERRLFHGIPAGGPKFDATLSGRFITALLASKSGRKPLLDFRAGQPESEQHRKGERQVVLELLGDERERDQRRDDQ